MATQKPLSEMVPDILEHVRRHTDMLEFNLRIYRVLEGQLRKEVEDSLRKEIISSSALNRALERIPPINVLRKAVDKLSKVYIEAPVRLTDNATDQDVMSAIARESNMDKVMMNANRIYNAQNAFALEPYIENGKHKVRVLAAHQFLPYSDDPRNPMQVTVMVKILGQETITVPAEYDMNGNLIHQERMREVDLYALYSDREYLIVDSDGRVRIDKMRNMGLSGKNPFGRIPFVYGNKSQFQLVPFPNQEGFDVSILVPKLLTDLNYAAQFMSHSIIWSKNADLAGQEINPDAIVDLGDSNADGGEPEIGTIDPKVDIERIIGLIDYEMKSYFSSIGIKVDAQANMSETSGVAKAMDEGDTTAERKVQLEYFRTIENELWSLMESMQKVWASDGLLEENRRFSDSFSDTFRIKYAEMKPLKSDKQKLEEIQMWRDQKLMTRKQALRQLRPDFTESQIDAWIKELDEEAEEAAEKFLSMGITSGAERSADGTFNEENQAAIEQDPAKRQDAELAKREA